MKYEEALKLLDNNFDKNGHGRNKMERPNFAVSVFLSKNGLYECTCDWPIPYHPKKEDMEADDWEIRNFSQQKGYDYI